MDDVHTEEEGFDSVGSDLFLNEYQHLAEKFVNQSLDFRGLLGNMAMGVAGEAGEVVDLVKKHLYHGHPLDMESLEDELGDVLWYVALGCTVLGVDFSGVAFRNLRKLSARYPEGFSCERSLCREC